MPPPFPVRSAARVRSEIRPPLIITGITQDFSFCVAMKYSTQLAQKHML